MHLQIQLAANTLLLLPFAAASSATADEIATGVGDATFKEGQTVEGKVTDAKAKGAMPMAKPQAKVQQPVDSGADTLEGKLSTMLRKAKEKLFFRALCFSWMSLDLHIALVRCAIPQRTTGLISAPTNMSIHYSGGRAGPKLPIETAHAHDACSTLPRQLPPRTTVCASVSVSHQEWSMLWHAEEPTPPIGSARLSYAKTLQLLNNRMVKRLTIMADGKLALVEVPIYMGGHDYDTQRYDSSDFSALYAREFPEWRMEMLRYYVELPGDFWQESNLHRLIKQSLPHRTGDGCASGCCMHVFQRAAGCDECAGCRNGAGTGVIRLLGLAWCMRARSAAAGAHGEEL